MTLHYNLPMEEYLAHPAIGSSHLKQILYSPRDFLMYKKRHFKDTPQTMLGTAIHCALTEFDHFEDRYAVQPESWGPRNTGDGYKLWKAFKEENEGKICLGFDHKNILDDVLQARAQHDGLIHIFDRVGGKPEVTAYTDLVDGIQLKARTDWLGNDGVLWDIKTTSKGCSDFEIYRTIRDMGYHFQAAHHMRVISHRTEVRGFGWIFVDTDSPSVNIVTRIISPSLLEWGDRDLDKALEILAHSIKTDSWPRRWDDTILTVSEYHADGRIF